MPAILVDLGSTGWQRFPEPTIDFNQLVRGRNRLLREAIRLEGDAVAAEAEWAKPNNGQRVAAEAIVSAVENSESLLRMKMIPAKTLTSLSLTVLAARERPLCRIR